MDPPRIGRYDPAMCSVFVLADANAAPGFPVGLSAALATGASDDARLLAQLRLPALPA